MATIIYEKTPGGLIASSERSVSTFDSGLCRIDQTYTCKTASADIHRTELVIGATMPDGNTSPSFDGLFIFPTPQEVTRQDGFTDFLVSSYGRTAVESKNFDTTIRTTNTNLFYYSLYETAGSVATKRGSPLVYADLGLSIDLFRPFGFVPISSEDEVTSVQDSIFGPFVSKFVNWDGYVIDRITRQYVVTTLQGTTGLIDTQYLNIPDPVIVSSLIRNFGAFSEIEFSTSQVVIIPKKA